MFVVPKSTRKKRELEALKREVDTAYESYLKLPTGNAEALSTVLESKEAKEEISSFSKKVENLYKDRSREVIQAMIEALAISRVMKRKEFLEADKIAELEAGESGILRTIIPHAADLSKTSEGAIYNEAEFLEAALTFASNEADKRGLTEVVDETEEILDYTLSMTPKPKKVSYDAEGVLQADDEYSVDTERDEEEVKTSRTLAFDYFRKVSDLMQQKETSGKNLKNPPEMEEGDTKKKGKTEEVEKKAESGDGDVKGGDKGKGSGGGGGKKPGNGSGSGKGQGSGNAKGKGSASGSGTGKGSGNGKGGDSGGGGGDGGGGGGDSGDGGKKDDDGGSDSDDDQDNGDGDVDFKIPEIEIVDVSASKARLEYKDILTSIEKLLEESNLLLIDEAVEDVEFDYFGTMDSAKYRRVFDKVFEKNSISDALKLMIILLHVVIKDPQRIMNAIDGIEKPKPILVEAQTFIKQHCVKYVFDWKPGKICSLKIPEVYASVSAFLTARYLVEDVDDASIKKFKNNIWFGNMDLGEDMQKGHKAWATDFWTKTVKSSKNKNGNKAHAVGKFHEDIYEQTAADSYPFVVPAGEVMFDGSLTLKTDDHISFYIYLAKR